MRPGSSTRPSVSKQVPPERGVFDPEEIIRVLDRHKVEYVIVGGVAARLHGSPILTEDVDVAPQRSADNLRRLAEALRELDAHLDAPGTDAGLRVPLDAATFSSPVMKFLTRAGEVDIVLEMVGVGGYDEIVGSAVEYRVFDMRIRVASLDDIITSKEASDRPKDRAHLEMLRQLAEELERERHAENVSERSENDAG
jgi:hypothetical protein